jgi:nucleoside-diphosphate-sugar epimerase
LVDFGSRAPRCCCPYNHPAIDCFRSGHAPSVAAPTGGVRATWLFFHVGSREAVATYIHVDDVVDVIQQAVFKERTENEIYNVSNDCSVEV